MTIQDNLKRLIQNSILLEPKRKKRLLVLIPQLADFELAELEQILEKHDKQATVNLFAKQFEKDPEGNFLKPFNEYVDRVKKKFYSGSEKKSVKKDEQSLENLMSKLDTL